MVIRKRKLTGCPVGPSIPGSPAMPCTPWMKKGKKKEKKKRKRITTKLCVYFSADYSHHCIFSTLYFTGSFMVKIGYSTFNKQPIFKSFKIMCLEDLFYETITSASHPLKT